MSGFKDLLASERGIFSLVALLLVTILAALRVIDGAGWLDFVKWLVGALILSKTITTAVDTHANRQPPPAPLT